MRFIELIDKITSGEPVVFMIKGLARKIVFCAKYYTEHYPEEEYFKIFFDDGTILEVMPKSEDLYFCDDERREIDRGLITNNGECLKIDGEEFLSENNDDKQYVKKIYYGDIKDGEGECVFSDYGFMDEVWSLAVLDNGEISDVHVKKINIEDVGVE